MKPKMDARTRIIPIVDLPDSLWCDEILYIAPALACEYGLAVRRHGLEQLAGTRSQRAPVGGVTAQAAAEHFAQAFDGSVARTALALLDPKGEVSHVADALARTLAGGKIAILDVPSGAGAFSLSLLCSLAELRSLGVVPRQPLDVVVVGGEFNPEATKYANELYARVSSFLTEQAINVSHRAMNWDVCDKVSTAKLLKQFIVDAATVDRKLIALSNFSGFLTMEGKRKEAGPQLEQIFLFSSGSAIGLWIEPQTNVATHGGGLLNWVEKLVKEKLPRVAKLVGLSDAENEGHSKTEANFALPLKPERTATARLAVLRFDLPGERP